VCAVSLWRNRPRAKVASLVALWGVLLPQVLWYTEFLVDWNAGVGVTTAVIGAIGLVALPTALLFDGSSTLTGWPLATGRIRILITAIAVGWLGLLATNMIDHSYQLDSWFAYTSALAAIPLAALSIYGLIRLRTWALWTSIGTALAVGMVAFAFTWTSYTLSGGYFGAPGYIDSFVHSTTSCSLRVVSAALLPALAIAALTAPFLHACFKRNTLVAHNE
jgi:hypothetical protein